MVAQWVLYLVERMVLQLVDALEILLWVVCLVELMDYEQAAELDDDSAAWKVAKMVF